ncbi:biotin/lipoyl-containing protein [Amycolatopsis pithecellobii]|uniref:Lipoyl-binding domain-containing protein n=1 Tax=Amycolatopsis pithecellobii TaxID=664692 RepID=A0A6N7Z568_9PSEU|nr:biotin/lipoyl-containing protein [Amycolatopsis pithecellobii]MTD55664.1 hypothetical protein [Amycolatopsis pithecellobii]
MTIPIKLPSFGDMTDGTVLSWLKQVNDPVTEGEPLVLIETAKAEVEVEAPASGILTKIVAEPGETVDIGDDLGAITTRE